MVITHDTPIIANYIMDATLTSSRMQYVTLVFIYYDQLTFEYRPYFAKIKSKQNVDGKISGLFLAISPEQRRRAVVKMTISGCVHSQLPRTSFIAHYWEGFQLLMKTNLRRHVTTAAHRQA
jgi:hypothetical protein